jgi:SAM-dependent methyltransferase
MSRLLTLLLVFLAVLLLAGPPPAAQEPVPVPLPSVLQNPEKPQGSRAPDIHYVPTPPEVVDEMLRMAKVKKEDIVYDLGSGDGRIVIAAAKQYGARGVGIDIDPERIREARENARREGVEHLVEFREADLFESNFSRATVVTLYLLERLNLRLRPKLWKELKPGTRIVSHQFGMGDWQPEQTATIEGRTIYMWTVPAKPPEEK